MDKGKSASVSIASPSQSQPQSWDAIRSVVRRHRADQPHPHAFAVPRDFCFDDAAGRLYFLALETVNSSVTGNGNGTSKAGKRQRNGSGESAVHSPVVATPNGAPSPPRQPTGTGTIGRRNSTRPRALSLAQLPGPQASGHTLQPVKTWSVFYASLERPAQTTSGVGEGYQRRRRKSYADVAAALSRKREGREDSEDDEMADGETSRTGRTQSRNTTLNDGSTFEDPDDESVFGGHGVAYSPGSAASLVALNSFPGYMESSKSLPALPKFLLSHSTHSSDSPTRTKVHPFVAEPFPLLPISFVVKQTNSSSSSGSNSAPASPTTLSISSNSTNPRDDGSILRDAARSTGIRGLRFKPLADCDGKHALMAFSHGDALHAGVLDSAGSHATFSPATLNGTAASACHDVKLSPSNSDLVSYIRQGDLYISTVPNHPELAPVEHRLTFSSVEYPDGGVTCGTGEYVMQEEFGRHTGYWWSPSSLQQPLSTSLTASDKPRHRILYFQVDERKVEGIVLPRPGDIYGFSTTGGQGDRVPYPRAGGSNAICDPKVVEFEIGNDGLEHVSYRALYGDRTLKAMFPWMEYVIRAGWLPDGSAVWFQLLDRAQQRFVLVKVPLELFQTEEEMEQMTSLQESSPISTTFPILEAGEPYVEVLWDEHTSLWINAHDCLKFVEPPLFSAKPIVLAFIFASEKSGVRQLYHVAVHAGLRTHTRTSSNPSAQHSGPAIVYPHCTIRQLTCGDGPVSTGELVGVDEQRHLVYFHGKREDPTESHLFVCSYAEGQGRIVDTVDSRTRVKGYGMQHHHHHGNGHHHHHHHPVVEEWDDHVVVLTDSGKSHAVTMNPACTKFVDVSSSVADPPECRVFELVFDAEKEEGVNTSPRRGGNGNGNGNGHGPGGIAPLSTSRPRDMSFSVESPPIRSGSFSDVGFNFSSSFSRSRANSRSSASFIVPTIVRPRMPKARLLATLPNPKRADTVDDHGEMEVLEADEDMFRMQLGEHGEFDGEHAQIPGSGLPPFSPTDDLVVEQDYTLSTPLPVIFSFTNSANVTLYGMLYYPDQGAEAGNLPTIVRVYGGPDAQVVTNDWKSPQWTRTFLALKLGYCVLIVDNRGSWDRGLAFEAPIQGRFATVEISDQIEALLYVMCCTTLGEHLDNGNLLDVVRRLGVEWTVGVDSLDSIWARCKAATTTRRQYQGARRLVDPERVAVTGWSFGGYLALMMLARHPNIVRVAVAGAPVSQWSLYDTAYTERYLGTPQSNPTGYSRSSVLDVTHCLPDEENRLLIVHGALDENVQITHSLMLVSSLVKVNKPHQIQIYPNERHGLKHASNAEHYDTLFFHFLAKAFRGVVET